MSSIGSGSFLNLTASVAHSIAASESATPPKTAGPARAVSAADSMQGAFETLMQANKGEAGSRSAAPPGVIEPFVPPQLPSGELMGAIKEALGAYQEIAGLKQRSNPSAQSAQRVGLESDMQRLGDLGGAQRVGLESDKQRLLAFDKQRVGAGGAAADAEPQGGSPAVQLLDDANRLFRLLDQVVAGDQAIGQRPNQMLR